MIQRQDEISIEVDRGPPIEAGLKKRLDLLAARACVGQLFRVATVDPGGGPEIAECFAGISIKNLEVHRRFRALQELVSRANGKRRQAKFKRDSFLRVLLRSG